VEEVQDPIGKRGWPKEKGRDGERTPMQWDAAANAGFSTAKPWNPVGPRYAQYNVAMERKDPNSILNWYQKVIALRKSNPALLEGKYIPLNEDDPNVLAYVRSYKGQNVLVVLNMSGSLQKVNLDLATKGVKAQSAKTLAATFKAPATASMSSITLEPFAAWIAQLQ
jgi:alpha-glucosidase